MLSLGVCGLILLTFAAARWLSVRLGQSAWANPVLATAVAAGGAVVALGAPMEAFSNASAPLRWMLGPAVVALAVVADAARGLLRGRALAVLGAIFLGTLIGLASALAAAAALGLAPDLRAAVAGKSISGPFIYAILGKEAGPVPLAAAISVFTGVIGAVCLPQLFKWLRLEGPENRSARALGLGVSAHLVGSEYAMRRDPEQGGLAIIALVIAGLMAALYLPWVWRWLMASAA